MTNASIFSKKGFVLICLLACGFLLWSRPAAPEHPMQCICLTFDKVEERVEVTQQGQWRYHPGDNPEWADPTFDDAGWETVDPEMADGNYPSGGWSGIGWFRLHIEVDSTLWKRPIGLIFQQTGASEIYVDGRRLFMLGRAGRTAQEEKTHYRYLRQPLPISFDAGRRHVLAVRYSHHNLERVKRFPNTPVGFIAEFGDFLRAEAVATEEARQIVSYQMFFTGVPLAFSLLHLLLFLFYRRHRENLYFSITSLFMAGLTYAAFRNYFIGDLHVWFTNYWLFKLTLIGLCVAGTYFVYSLFHPRPPRHGWGILGIGLILVLISRWVSHNYAYFFGFIALAEQLRVISAAVKNRRDGAWIIGLGFLAFALGGGYQMLTGLGYIPRFSSTIYAYLWGFMGLLLFMSIYLARQFARIHINLEYQIEQVKELSSKALEQERQAQEQRMERVRLEEENKRRTQELEEARELQKVMEEREALQRLSQRLTGPLTPKEIGRTVAEESGRLFGHDALILAMFDESTGKLSGIHCEDTPVGAEEPEEVPAFQADEPTPLQRDVLTGQSKLTNRDKDLTDTQLIRFGYESRMSRSIMFVPIRWEDRSIGILSVQSYTPGRYSARELKLLETFADQCGGALVRVQTEQELKNTQAQLVQAEKMGSLGMLVAGVAHEINTPVGAISSTHNTVVRAVERLRSILNTLIGETDGPPNVEKLLKIIEKSNRVISSGTERVTDIVQRLKSFAHLDEAELKKGDIHEGIEDTLIIVHHELKYKAVVERNFADIPPIACYPGQLNQVYLNLLINAAQSIEEKGTITITTSQQDERVHIEIRDTGVGIPEEELGRIFDPFYTTKEAGVGTGLGLSICYQIIRDHHGEILVQSEVGKGTTFTIVLPMNLDEILNSA